MVLFRAFAGGRSLLAGAFGAALLGLAAGTTHVRADPATPPPNAQPEASLPDVTKVDIRLGVKIPLRDGVQLKATLYTPRGQAAPAPCVVTLTPYLAQTYHDRGVYFAAHGLPFLIVDVRGRGDSEGRFNAFLQEANDGYDVVEWLARQPSCNGKVAMWGGSYAGQDQWTTAATRPPHLATIVPTAAPYWGADAPQRALLQMFPWLVDISGHAMQDGIYEDAPLWANLFYQRYVQGQPSSNLGATFGLNSALWSEWIKHPEVDNYIDSYNPTPEQLRALTLPVLTITGIYDDDQLGALTHYKTYMAVASPEQRARHYLIIGPWDHAGTRTPQAEVGGVKFGSASLLDLSKIHLDWYNWVMSGSEKPAFLKNKVAYYVTGREQWRYADSLPAVTTRMLRLFLDSRFNADSVWSAGALAANAPHATGFDRYLYDPTDISLGRIERDVDPSSLVDQRLVLASDGKQLVYQTAPFETPTEVSGFAKLETWIAINRPDTDFRARLYEIDCDGKSILLTKDMLRARHRESPRIAKLVEDEQARLYTFNSFTFVSRQIAAGSRIRLIIDPINSIYAEKNYNAAKPVSQQTMADAQPVTVRLLHDPKHPSALYLPIGQPG